MLDQEPRLVMLRSILRLTIMSTMYSSRKNLRHLFI
nr:MAG TPA: hypothetical protein [Caudoviricetes sp.]